MRCLYVFAAGAHAIGIEFAHKAGGHSGIVVQILTQPAGALKMLVGDHGRHVDVAAIILQTPLSHAVELLQAQADRIAMGMAGGAGGRGGMRHQPVPHGAKLGIVGVIDDGKIHIRGRRRRRLAQEDIHQGDAALGRRAAAGMGEHAEHRSLGDDAAAPIAVVEFIGHPRAVQIVRHVIDPGERPVDEGLAGGEKLPEIAVVFQDQVHAGPQRLFTGGSGDLVAVFGIDGGVLGDGAKRVQLQEIAEEAAHPGFQARGRHQARYFRLHTGIAIQGAGAGGVQQARVRRRIPQHVAEPRRAAIAVESISLPRGTATSVRNRKSGADSRVVRL